MPLTLRKAITARPVAASKSAVARDRVVQRASPAGAAARAVRWQPGRARGRTTTRATFGPRAAPSRGVARCSARTLTRPAPRGLERRANGRRPSRAPCSVRLILPSRKRRSCTVWPATAGAMRRARGTCLPGSAMSACPALSVPVTSSVSFGASCGGGGGAGGGRRRAAAPAAGRGGILREAAAGSGRERRAAATSARPRHAADRPRTSGDRRQRDRARTAPRRPPSQASVAAPQSWDTPSASELLSACSTMHGTSEPVQT